MKIIIGLSCFLLLFITCRTEKIEENRNENFANSETANNSTINNSRTEYTDTLTLCQNDFLYKKIEKYSFTDFYSDSKLRNSISNNYKNDFEGLKAIETYLIRRDNDLIVRKGDTLYIKLKNNKNITFIDSTDYRYYIYQDYLPKLDYCLLFIHFYEGYVYGLLNLKDGKLTHIWGLPKFDKSNKRFISYSKELIADYNYNGFQLFDVEKENLVNVFECEFYDWGPGNIDWIDSETIIIERSFVKFTVDDIIYEKDYIELSLNAPNREGCR